MLLTYVLVTPARNEAHLIELTLRSVVEQTVRPLKWVIVSDGSTDGTDEIVQKYAAVHSWIQLVRMPERAERHFAGKVLAFNAGYDTVANLDFDVVANLDADVSFENDYFSYLLGKLSEDSRLGLVGTPFQEGSAATYDYRFTSIAHVSGACQVFRRECFEQIGGYKPVKGGCIDHIAVISARMRGWRTRTFTERVCQHHRPMGTAQHGLLAARFKNGQKDYAIGNHPLWEFLRAVYQTTKKPFLIGGVMLVAGYVWSAFTGKERPVSRDLIVFYRHEQMQRLKALIMRRHRMAQTNESAPIAY